MRFLLACFLCVTTCTFAHEVRIATYNVRLKIESDDRAGNGWEERRDGVRSLIRFYEFDIVGMQEALHPQWIDLQQIPGYTGVGAGRDDGKQAGEYSPILFRTSRFELLGHGTFWYSETPDTPSFGWDAVKYRRICTWVRLQDRQSQRSLLILNSHFDHEAVIARREAARLLTRKTEELAHADDWVCVMGDFNSTRESEPYRMLAQAFKDTRDLSAQPPYGPPATFNAFKFGTIPTERIDHIFVKTVSKVLRHGTVDDAIGLRYPSDHFPVFVDVVLPTGN